MASQVLGQKLFAIEPLPSVLLILVMLPVGLHMQQLLDVLLHARVVIFQLVHQAALLRQSFSQPWVSEHRIDVIDIETQAVQE